MLYTLGVERKERRQIATDYVRSINIKTSCVKCGKKPIEWHREIHTVYPNARVSSLRSQGASVLRIKKEMSLCEPLCRTCHMTVDGRLKILRKNQPYKKNGVYVDAAPCICCRKFYKPLRNGRCSSCDNHHSGRRIRKTKSCDGCCAKEPLMEQTSKD